MINLALKRLTCRIERGRSLMRYLPTKKFASIRVIRSSKAMKILARLLTEEISLTDKIVVHDAPQDLFRDVTKEKFPHLIISAGNDAPLIETLERGGLRYGKDFLSFQREYLKRCEEIFHALGK